MSEFEKERKEHPKFTDEQIHQIVQDHRKLKAMGLEEQADSWRYGLCDRAKFDRIKVEQIRPGMQLLKGRVKGTNRWEFQSYVLDKKVFKKPEAAKEAVLAHLKSQASMLVNYGSWNEYKRQAVNALVENSALR